MTNWCSVHCKVVNIVQIEFFNEIMGSKNPLLKGINSFSPVIATFLDRFIMNSLRLTKVFLKRVIAREYIQFVRTRIHDRSVPWIVVQCE
jgi:hypothetical protein